MPINTSMAILSVLEFLLWAVLGYVFWTKGLQKRFPAMSVYLALRVIAAPVLSTTLYLQSKPWGGMYFPVYFFLYWAVYIASAIALYFIALEVFRSALSGFSGLVRFGTVIFRWAAAACLIISLSTVNFSHPDMLLVPGFAFRLMRSVSILELCLLAFLCLSMNALRLAVRDVAFGLALGFGMLSSSDFITASLISRSTTFNDPVQYVAELMTLLVLGLWITYAALPEPVRKPVVVSANSTIYRWNEIASALGHTTTKVAVPAPATSTFFLTDVERVVEKVLTKNLKENEQKAS